MGAEFTVDTLADMCRLMCDNYMPKYEQPRGTYECFHCGTRGVIWDSDFSFEDYGEEGEGIIHECHCANCGARITYRISLDSEESEDKE